MRLPVVPSSTLDYTAQADPTDCSIEQSKHVDTRPGMGTDGLNDWSELNFTLRLVPDRLGLVLGFITLCINIIIPRSYSSTLPTVPTYLPYLTLRTKGEVWCVCEELNVSTDILCCINGACKASVVHRPCLSMIMS